jgi:hypothetical protein
MPAENSTDKTPPRATAAMEDDSVKRFVDLISEIVESTLAKVLAQVRIQMAGSSEATGSSAPTSPQKTGVVLRHGDRIKAEDLRIVLLMGKIPDRSSLLIDTKTLARLLSISKAHFYRLQAEESMPLPIHVGQRSTRRTPSGCRPPVKRPSWSTTAAGFSHKGLRNTSG